MAHPAVPVQRAGTDGVWTTRNGTYTIATIPLLAVLLIAGWFGVRKRVHEIHSTAPVHLDDESKTARWLKRPRVNYQKREGISPLMLVAKPGG
jgi:hypothetical protein